ncbi:hypothetical protein BDV25DRAFT_130401 [Aspergillus avenaceus]|uniref:Uncharacterized protein n=1 Tax=Aspergillus avenaceus TaxID=36643 RepID=A0A5N6TTK3_ASPAV|nr:hypothetical protein BDV25DRAFT_130401 [Aspergillus avenaceus]
MADSDPKRPQSDQPPLPSSIITSAEHSRVNTNEDGKLSDERDDRRISSIPVRGNASKPRPVPDESDSDDDDYTSSSGSDSDEDYDDDTEEHDKDVKSDDGSNNSLPRIPATQKPKIRRLGKNPDILSRLSAFLPQIKNANEELQREIDAGRAKDLRLDEVDDQDDSQYIEMNLGLGVLEEKRSGDTGEHNDDLKTAHGSDSKASNPDIKTDSNVLDTLMGNSDSPSSKKPTIEEMNE